MHVIAITNQKGGCGKTTTAVNLSASLVQAGRRVLLIDLDSQAASTIGLGYDPSNIDRTVYHVLTDSEAFISEAIIKTWFDGLDLVASNILLSGIEFELSKLYSRQYVLSNQVASVASEYDYCIIDCSPSLSLLTLNALVACDGVLIPVQTHYYALEGLKQLLETIALVRERFNQALSICGVLLTFFESNTVLSRQVRWEMEKFFGGLLFRTVISKTVRLAEAPSAGQPILSYSPDNKASKQYMALAEELCRRAPVKERVLDGQV